MWPLSCCAVVNRPEHQQKPEQSPSTKKRRARSKLALTCDHLQAARRLIADAIELATNAYNSFTNAPPKTRQLRNEAVLICIHYAK